jgi:hypothetical protein
MSTDTNIMDAASAYIEVEFGSDIVKKGGYYPFKNLVLKMLRIICLI